MLYEVITERVRVTLDGVWALFTPFGIIGGLKLGIVTPTEAGVFACVYSFFIRNNFV